MPDELARNAVFALVDLGALDDLFLQCSKDPPVDHVARSFVLIRAHDEASIVGTQARCEHACTPRPPGLPHGRGSEATMRVFLRVQFLEVLDGMQGLLLAWVGDLGDGWQQPVPRTAYAAIVAVTHCKDIAPSPDFSFLCTILWLFCYLQEPVHVDPTAATRALVTKNLLRHEVVGSLYANANVFHIGAALQLDLLPELWVLRVILHIVKLFDASRVHVLRAVLCSTVRQWAQAARQEVNDGEIQGGEEILKLGDPLNTDETCSDYKNLCVLLRQLGDLVVLLEDVASAALNVALVNVLPRAVYPGLLVDCWKPQGLTHLREWSEVASCADDAVVEGDGVPGIRVEDGLDFGIIGRELLHLAPDKLDTHLPLNDWLQSEAERIEMPWLHVRAQNTWGVLKELLGIHDGDIEMRLEITSTKEP
mmetsp:Transcript_139821/g.243505  ORF Transcript_139821/g.243505 Transcript_139821/m.243505 type:complete len:422 (-) Transcript_139821:128-1393(-)